MGLTFAIIVFPLDLPKTQSLNYTIKNRPMVACMNAYNVCTSPHVCALCIAHVAIVNKLSHTKYDVLWMSNGDIIKMKRELTSQLLNKVGKCIRLVCTHAGI